MAGERRALIVATDEYSDPKLTSLNAPAKDARTLAEVLSDETVGAFRVETVLNRPSHEVRLAIADFFGSGKYGDTLLAHFSCHGVKSPGGELYFAMTDTDMSDTFKLKVTGIPSALVRDAMEESRASLILCLVDCCYSGAFVKLAKSADTVDLTERLGGKGRAVITASTSLQLALDGEEEPSLFTHAVIEGLRSGEADRDLDGLVSLDELYDYVHERVTSSNPDQTPVRSFDVQGQVYVARRRTSVTQPAPLEPELLADARASVIHRRLGAVLGLAHVLDEKHPGRSLAARLELSRLATSDDSLKVRGQAQAALEAASEPPAPVIPDYEPTSATRGGPPLQDPLVADGAGVVNATPIEAEIATESLAGTDIEADADAQAAVDVDTVPYPDDDTGGQERGRSPRALGRAGLIALGVGGVLLVGGFAWRALDDEAAVTSSEQAAGLALSATEVLLTADDPQLGRGIVALDTETASIRMILQDPSAVLPTVSEDRQWMAYLTIEGETSAAVPRLVRVDGSDGANLLDPDASQQCPSTTRPAFSPDGGFLAVVCEDSAGETVGLGIVDRDGQLVRLVEQDDFRGAPTWTGDGRIVVARDVEGDGTTTLWAVSADGGEQEPLTDGLGGSDSHPDWSDHGLLLLRERDGASNVVYRENVDTRGVEPITVHGRAQSPTWAPGDDPTMVWLEPAAEGDGMTLWTQTIGDPFPTELHTGAYGPPAWGSR